MGSTPGGPKLNVAKGVSGCFIPCSCSAASNTCSETCDFVLTNWDGGSVFNLKSSLSRTDGDCLLGSIGISGMPRAWGKTTYQIQESIFTGLF